MNPPETPPIWKPLPTKLRAYEAVYWLNRSFEATLLSLERLEKLGMFRLVWKQCANFSSSPVQTE